MTDWGWCSFIELNILCTHYASRLLFVTFVECHLWHLPWSYELAMSWYNLKLQRRFSPAKSDTFSIENTFGMPFKQRKILAANQCSERKRQDIGVFAIMIGEVNVGNRQGWFSWAKRHWGWRLYTEVNMQSNHVSYNLLFSGAHSMTLLPSL